MTPTEKIMQALVFLTCDEHLDDPKAIRERFDSLQDDDRMHDSTYLLRAGDATTGLPCDSSRHYESRAVAAEMLDDSWVGWTYWYGGGKHGEPESIPWMEDAYDVIMTEVPKIVKEFKRA